MPQNVTVEILSWGDTGEKKRKRMENDDEKQKEYEKNRPDRKFSSKWQTEQPWSWLVTMKKT